MPSLSLFIIQITWFIKWDRERDRGTLEHITDIKLGTFAYYFKSGQKNPETREHNHLTSLVFIS